MIKATDIATAVPGLRKNDRDLERFLAQRYDHRAQMRNQTPSGIAGSIYPTSTRFDGDPT
jgi:hypothetical protein